MVEKTDNDISELYAEVTRQQPLHTPVSLDRKILAEAHRALDSKPSTRAQNPRRVFYRWAPSFAMAATVVLTVTVIYLLPQSQRSTEVVALRQQTESSPRSAAAKNKTTPASSAVSVEKESALEIDNFLRSKQESKISAQPEDAATVPTFSSVATLEKEVLASDLEILFDSSATGTVGIPQAIAVEEMEESAAQAGKKTTASSPVPAVATTKPIEPDLWRKKIEKLLADKKEQDAEEEFEKFKKNYPQHEYIEIYEKKIQELKSE